MQNSLLLAGALSAAGVRYEMHLYPRGVHGLSLATPEVDEPEKHRVADPHIAGWFGSASNGWYSKNDKGVIPHGNVEKRR